MHSYFACNSNFYRWWENSGEAVGGEFGHTFSQKPFPKTHIASKKLPFQRNLVSQPPFFRGELWNFGGVSWKTFRLTTESFLFRGMELHKRSPETTRWDFLSSFAFFFVFATFEVWPFSAESDFYIFVIFCLGKPVGLFKLTNKRDDFLKIQHPKNQPLDLIKSLSGFGNPKTPNPAI